MSLWSRWFGQRRHDAAPSRWVAVDTETTGLDAATDSLLAIGAVALRDGVIALDDSFEVTLRQAAIRAGPDILVHGIGVGSQREGESPVAAVDAFLAYLGSAPLIGFHAAFDLAVLRRGCAAQGRRFPRRPWLDVAELAPVLRPELAARCEALDDWLSACGIRCDNRHNAAADALATGQLLACLLPTARRQGIVGFDALRKAAGSARWLKRSGH